MKGHPSYFLFLAVVAGVMEDGNYSYFMKTTPTHPSPSILEHQIACLEQYLSHNPYLEQPMESNLLNNRTLYILGIMLQLNPLVFFI